ncbi:MAG: hypothetical protein MMC23_000608 [Stictis urceolatum]|nr:hypothetical protein [Stictis urceolata]
METRLADFDVHPHVREERLDQGVAQFREDRNRHFDITGDWDRDVDVDGLPPDGSKGFLLNSMAFTEQEYKDLFDPVVESNIALIKRQIASYSANVKREGAPEKEVKYLVVASLAPHVLRERFEEYFRRSNAWDTGYRSRRKETKELLPWFEEHFQSPLIRPVEKYDKGTHGTWNATRMYRDGYEKQRMAPHRMKRLIQKEESIPCGAGKEFKRGSGEIHQDVRLEHNFVFNETLFVSKARIENSAALYDHSDDIKEQYNLDFDLANDHEAKQKVFRHLNGRVYDASHLEKMWEEYHQA